MITNLVFKRINNDMNPPRTELKIVEVNIPEIDSNEGWVLSTSGEIVTVTKLLPKEEPHKKQEVQSEFTQINTGDSFTSHVPGTARLVRKDDRILIGYRKGKSVAVRDRTDRNSVCIDDITKVHFFNACKSAHGRDTKEWYLSLIDPGYVEWNNFIDKEYESQLSIANKKLYDDYLAASANKNDEN